MQILRKTAAVLLSLCILAAPAGVSAAGLNEAEMAAMADYIAARTEGEPYAVRLALSAVLLNQLKDPRYPDTVSGVLGREGYRALRRRSPAYDSARAALRAAVEGLDITDGAVAWSRRGTPAGVTPHLVIGEWTFGE